MKFYPDVYLPELPANERPEGYLGRLRIRLNELFRDVALTLDNPDISGIARINRSSQLPNIQYDLYGGTVAVTHNYTGTIPTPTAGNHTFVYAVRPSVSLAGTSQFRGYDFDITFSASSAGSAGYGVIGALNCYGAGSFKGVYGRSAAQTGFTGVTVGLVGGTNFVSTQSDAYALQLDITGPDSVSLPTNLATGILVGSNNAGSKSHLGIYFNNQVSYNNAVVRWNHRDTVETASFLEQLNSGGTSVHSVDYLGRTTKAFALTLVGNGTPFFVAAANLTAQTAAVAPTTIFTTTAAGHYRFGAVATVTTAGTTSTLGAISATWTDGNDSVVKTRVGGTDSTNVTSAAVGLNASMYCKTGTAIQYGCAYASSGTPMQFDLSVTVEYLG